MNNIIALIFWGWLAFIAAQLLPYTKKYRLLTIAGFSIAFLFYVSPSIAQFSLIIAWVVAIYFLNLFVNKRWILTTYTFTVVAVFIAYKAGFILSGHQSTMLNNALPIGFSFIMFHSIALLSDRKNTVLEKPVPLKEVLSSTLFFPTILIGPFSKFQVFKEGIEQDYSPKRALHGYCIFCLGVFKFAVSGIFIRPDVLYTLPLTEMVTRFLVKGQLMNPLSIMLLLSFYLYTNFSGFSDIVVGFSKMMGFDVPFNFRFPFLAGSMAEYWRNWHITLGAWFKEYVFMPANYYLSKNIKSISANAASQISVFLTFFLIGIWHEFSLKILVYAICNALLVVFLFPKGKTSRWISWPITLVAALLINALFMSDSISTFLYLCESVFSPEAVYLNVGTLRTVSFVLILMVFTYASERLVDKLADYKNTEVNKFVILNFILSLILLFFGLTTGLSGVNAVYVGY